MEKYDAVVVQYGKIKYVPVEKRKSMDSGMCIVVPVTIHDVCPKSYLLVIVEIYKNCKFYCRKIKKIFTGCSEIEKSNLINSIFIGDFKFYFEEKFDMNCIKIVVDTQYLNE